MRKSWLAFCVMAVVGACGGGDDAFTPDVAPEANPLAGGAPLLPWPSTAFLKTDAGSATGFRVDFPAEAMPSNQDGIRVSTQYYNEADGFSPNAPILVGFAKGVSPDGLPSPDNTRDDVARSVGADSPVVLLEMDTGARVPLMAEVDQNIEEVNDRVLIIRPLVRLVPGTRYAVALRRSIKAADGSALEVPPTFQAILDGRDIDHPLWERMAPTYPQVLDAVEAAGVPRDDLLLAWDFVTASQEYLTSDLLTMRDRALPVMVGGADADALTFDGQIVSKGSPTHVYRFLTGTFDAPIFLSNEEADNSEMVRDADGLPTLQGNYRARFAALIPNCVSDPAKRPAKVVLFGHGLFGSGEDSLDSGFLQEVADGELCAVFVATDFIGLTDRNLATTALAVNDLNKGKALIDKLAQGVINFMALERFVRGPFATSDLFTYEGEPVIDTSKVYYYGASLGGIMGAVYMAYEPDIELGALGVPGANWSMLFERSLAWPALRSALQGSYIERYQYPVCIALLAMIWDRFDPITTAPGLAGHGTPVDGVPPKKIFLYEGMHDSLVTNYATEMAARTMGIPVTGPSLYVPYGLETASDGVSAALTIYDQDRQPYPPLGNLAPTEDNGTHSHVNEEPAVQRQINRFVTEGLIYHECQTGGSPAPCDCTVGACD